MTTTVVARWIDEVCVNNVVNLSLMICVSEILLDCVNLRNEQDLKFLKLIRVFYLSKFFFLKDVFLILLFMRLHFRSENRNFLVLIDCLWAICSISSIWLLKESAILIRVLSSLKLIWFVRRVDLSIESERVWLIESFILEKQLCW